MEPKGPESKRIKLEHSYAAMADSFLMDCSHIKEEDPLRISFEEATIKMENEDGVVVKKEVLENVDANRSFEYFDLPSISAPFENYSHSDSNTSTLVADESVHRNNERDCLGLIDNCDRIRNIEDPLTLVDKYAETVPKHVFLEFRKNYENTIKDLRSQNETLLNEAARLSKANNSVLPEDHADDPLVRPRPPSKWELQIELNRLKQELKASRAQEQTLEMRAQTRDQSDKKSYQKHLKERREAFDLMRQKFEQKLKDVRAAHNRDSERENAITKKKLEGCKKVIAGLKFELLKVTLDAENTIKGSIKNRQNLTEKLDRLKKELEDSRKNPVLQSKLQKTKEQLLQARKQVTTLQKLLRANKKQRLSLYWSKKTRDHLLKEQDCRVKKAIKKYFQKKQELVASRTVLAQKSEECKGLKEEVKTLALKLNKEGRGEDSAKTEARS